MVKPRALRSYAVWSIGERTIVWKQMCIPRYVSIVQILVWVSFYTVALPQLQLWHRHWLVSIQSMGDLHSQVSYVLHFISHGRVASVVETHWRLDVDQDDVARIPIITTSTIIGTDG